MIQSSTQDTMKFMPSFRQTWRSRGMKGKNAASSSVADSHGASLIWILRFSSVSSLGEEEEQQADEYNWLKGATQLVQLPLESSIKCGQITQRTFQIDITRRGWVVLPALMDCGACGSGDLYFHFRYLCLLFFPSTLSHSGSICGAEITSDWIFSRFFSSLGVKTW